MLNIGEQKSWLLFISGCRSYMTVKAPILYFGKVLQYSGKMKLMI